MFINSMCPFSYGFHKIRNINRAAIDRSPKKQIVMRVENTHNIKTTLEQ